jgi:hypothetical protein
VSTGGISRTGPEGGDAPGGGAAQDPERAALERRCRRLLRCYPPNHREVHREEMLGVPLAAARARAAHAGPGAGGEPGRLRAGDPGPPGPQLAGRPLAGRLGRGEPDRPGADAHHRRPGLRSGGPGSRGGSSEHPGGGSVLAGRARAPSRWARGGDGRLAGRGAAGADRPPPGSRGDRVDPVGAGPAEPARGDHAADRRLVRRASPVPGHGRSGLCRRGQRGGMLAWLLGRPAARPGDRGEAASLPHDRGPVRRPRVPRGRSAGEPFRAAARSCLQPPGRPGDRGRGRRYARTQRRGLAGRVADSGRAPA